MTAGVLIVSRLWRDDAEEEIERFSIGVDGSDYRTLARDCARTASTMAPEDVVLSEQTEHGDLSERARFRGGVEVSPR